MTFLKKPRTLLALGLLPLLGSSYYLSRYAVTGLPLMDDFTYTTAFIFPFEAAQGIWAKWKILFVQHFVTEHRIPSGKLFIYLLYRLGGGELNWKLLAWSGNVCIPGVVFVLGWVWHKTGRSLAYLLPLAFGVFQVQHYELFFWANCSLLYVPVVFFALGATYFLVYHCDYRPVRFALALGFTLLCMYSFGNGMFVFATNALLLTYQQRWKALAAMLALGAVCAVTYFIGYHSEYPTRLNALALLNFWALMGAWLEPLNAFGPVARYGAVALGVLATAVFGWFGGRLAWRKAADWRWLRPETTPELSREELFYTVGLVFLMLTGAAVAVKRWSPDLGEMVTSRYRYIGVLVLSIGYLLSVHALKTRRTRRVLGGLALGLSAGIHVLSYPYYLPKLVNDREKLIAGTFNYQQHQTWCLFPAGSFWAKYIDSNTAVALKTGLYRFPAQYYSEAEPELLRADTTQRLTLPLTLHREAAYTLLRNDTFQPSATSRPRREGTCLLLQSPRHGVFLVPIQRLANAGRWNLLTKGQVFGTGFVAYLPLNAYPPGRYRVGLFHRENGKAELGYTGQTVDL